MPVPPAAKAVGIEVRPTVAIDNADGRPVSERHAQVAELVDALVSGTSGESRGGSSPLLGTSCLTVARVRTNHRNKALAV